MIVTLKQVEQAQHEILQVGVDAEIDRWAENLANSELSLLPDFGAEDDIRVIDSLKRILIFGFKVGVNTGRWMKEKQIRSDKWNPFI